MTDSGAVEAAISKLANTMRMYVQAHMRFGDLVAVGNRLHHRDHPLFSSLYARLFLDDDPTNWRGASFLWRPTRRCPAPPSG